MMAMVTNGGCKLKGVLHYDSLRSLKNEVKFGEQLGLKLPTTERVYLLSTNLSLVVSTHFDSCLCSLRTKDHDWPVFCSPFVAENHNE